MHSQNPETTRRLGESLGKLLRPGDVIALSGELGAGKTCFTQGVARGLGVDPSVPVTSPTFTLVGEYPGRVPLRHVDFYRIESEERLFELGFDDLLDGRGVLVVEWPERIPLALPASRIEVSISVTSEPGTGREGSKPGAGDASEQGRTVRFDGVGPRAMQVVEGLLGAWSERA